MLAARRSAALASLALASLAVPFLAVPSLALAASAAEPGAGKADVDHPGQTLEQYRGKKRPVVILSDQRDDPRIAKQKAALGGAGAGERGIAVLSEDDANGALHKRLHVGNGFAVVLIGKDGGVKNVWREPVDSGKVFTVIDSMPMRQDEMNG